MGELQCMILALADRQCRLRQATGVQLQVDGVVDGTDSAGLVLRGVR